MGTEIMRFFVLGKIPGTSVQLTYWQMGTCLISFIVLISCIRLYFIARSKLLTIDPYYRAPRGMTVIELTSL